MAYDPWAELEAKRAQQAEDARRIAAMEAEREARDAAALNAEWGAAAAGLPVPGDAGGRLDDLPSLEQKLPYIHDPSRPLPPRSEIEQKLPGIYDPSRPPPKRSEIEQLLAQDAAAEEQAIQAGLAGPRAYMGPQGQGQDAMAMAELEGQNAATYFGMAGQRQTARVRDPLHEPVQEFGQEMREGLGAQTEGQKQRLEAERMGAAQQAAALNQYERELETEMNVRKAAQRVQLQNEADAIEGIRQKQSATAEAIKQFIKMPKFSTAWADRDAGSRAAIVMASLADAFSGFGRNLMAIGGGGVRPPPTFVKDLLAQERATYETKRASAAHNIDMLNADEAAAIRAYDQVRSHGASKREGDLLQDQARLGVMEAEFKRLLAENNVQTLSAAQQELLGQIQQQKAQNDLELTQLELAHPKYRTVSASPFTPQQQKMLGVAFKDALDNRGKLQQAWLKRMEEGGVDPKMLAQYQKERQPYEEILSMANRVREEWQGKVPWLATGHGILPQSENLAKLTKESREFIRATARIIQKKLRVDSGAVISDQEAEREAANYLGQYRTEEEVWNGIRALEQQLRDSAQLIDRGYANEIVQQYNRNAEAVTPGARAGVAAGPTQGHIEGFTAR